MYSVELPIEINNIIENIISAFYPDLPPRSRGMFTFTLLFMTSKMISISTSDSQTVHSLVVILHFLPMNLNNTPERLLSSNVLV